MDISINTGGNAHNTQNHGQTASSFPGFPNVNDGPDAYLEQLLSHNGVGEPPKDGFFSSTGGGHEEKSGWGNTLLKWGVGILAGAALWQILAKRKAGDFIRRGVTSLKTNGKSVTRIRASQLGNMVRSTAGSLSRLSKRLKL